VAITTVLVLGIGGIGVGLGAMKPDFRADNPAKIVGSLNGLVFLLVALCYTGLVLLLLAYPLWAVHRLSRGDELADERLGLALALVVLTLLAAAAATAVPLWLGARSLEQRE
jgi:uncharacterized membrane protein YidH (DUF202 family)